MADELEESIIRDLLGSGATGDPGAPNRSGVTPEEIASSVPQDVNKVEKILEKMASFDTSPVEECGHRRYRLESASDGRSYLNDEYDMLPPEAWPGLPEKEDE